MPALSVEFAVWLGVLGWSLQSLVEFSLYLPALAWPAFVLLGWLLGVRGRSPKSEVQGPKSREEV